MKLKPWQRRNFGASNALRAVIAPYRGLRRQYFNGAPTAPSFERKQMPVSSDRPFLLDQSKLPYLGWRDPPPETVIAGAPRAEVWSADPLPGGASVRYGFWTGQPGAINCDSYPNDEMFSVIEGLVALECRDGTRLEVGPGDTAVVRKGWQGIWHTLQVTRKIFVIVDPALETDEG